LVQLLAFNDYGHLSTVGNERPHRNTDAGGAEYLSTHLSSLNAPHAHVTAGTIGALPLLSGMFHDELAYCAQRDEGDVSSVGNHN
jgi:hypothetical protein